MLGNVIPLPQVLDAMETGNQFSMRVISYDKGKKTGGKILEFKSAILFKGKPKAKGDNEPVTVSTEPKVHKKPNHWKNRTRNIKVMPSGQVRTIHIRNITAFNGIKVVY